MDIKHLIVSPAVVVRTLATGMLLTFLSIEVFGQSTSQKLPTWPQTFDLQGPVMKTFGIPVTQPGPIDVDLKISGAPIIATLQGPAGELARQQGNGALHLSYIATSRDIQGGPILIITATLAEPQKTATVTVVARHPPIDEARHASAVAAATRTAEGLRDAHRAEIQQRVAAARAQVDANLERDRAALQQRRAQEHAALMAQIQPDIDRLRSRQQVTTRVVAPLGPRPVPRAPNISALTVKNSTVTQLSIDNPVFINGSGFGTAKGTLHFVIGVGQDVVVDPNFVVWSDAQIFATVPGPTIPPVALPTFNGTVYLLRADGVQSNLQPFTFIPPMDYRTILVSAPMADGIFQRSQGDNFESSGIRYGTNLGIVRFDGDCISGHTGMDKLFTNTQLKNGWVVRGAPTMIDQYSFGGGGGSFAIAFQPLTTSPALDVVWWVNVGAFCNSSYGYSVAIPIQGPINLPDGVAWP